MSAPDTNVEKQERRHKAPLLGMRAAIVIAALGLIALVFYTALQSDDEGVVPATEATPTVDVTPSN